LCAWKQNLFGVFFQQGFEGIFEGGAGFFYQKDGVFTVLGEGVASGVFNGLLRLEEFVNFDIERPGSERRDGAIVATRTSAAAKSGRGFDLLLQGVW